MPRTGKDRREEYRLFLKNNRITYNETCRECLRDCKQAHTATVVCCPNFITGREGRDIS